MVEVDATYYVLPNKRTAESWSSARRKTSSSTSSPRFDDRSADGGFAAAQGDQGRLSSELTKKKRIYAKTCRASSSTRFTSSSARRSSR